MGVPACTCTHEHTCWCACTRAHMHQATCATQGRGRHILWSPDAGSENDPGVLGQVCGWRPVGTGEPWPLHQHCGHTDPQAAVPAPQLPGLSLALPAGGCPSPQGAWAGCSALAAWTLPQQLLLPWGVLWEGPTSCSHCKGATRWVS